ncbi:rCG32507 [Rattus norvegicus]|uniref:RCG32507 n=1 Tax=Rattus norvegicus TaxID=10116 RepID=A6HHE3_RAT|nr:rCG32507 [Rattus norvegicus]
MIPALLGSLHHRHS